MKKARFNFLKWTPLAAVVALAVTLSVNGSRATSSLPTAVAAPDVDLSNELRILNRYGDDLFAYQKECSRLKKKTSLVQADIDPLQRRSDDLKRRLTEVSGAIREIIRKLKAANQWDDLDTATAANITDPGARTAFLQESFKAELEEAASSLNSRSSEISTPLDNLRKRLTGRSFSPGDDRSLQVVLATYRVPSPMEFVSLACTVQNVRTKLIKRLGGIPNSAACVAQACACAADPSIKGTATICATSSFPVSDCPAN